MHMLELINSIQRRPLFFLRSASIYDLDTFIRGFRFCQASNTIEENDHDKSFNEFRERWIHRKMGLDEDKSYVQCLLFESHNPEAAFEKFFELWELFLVDVKEKQK